MGKKKNKNQINCNNTWKTEHKKYRKKNIQKIQRKNEKRKIHNIETFSLLTKSVHHKNT